MLPSPLPGYTLPSRVLGIWYPCQSLRVLHLKWPFWFNDLYGWEGPKEGGVQVTEEVTEMCSSFLVCKERFPCHEVMSTKVFVSEG